MVMRCIERPCGFMWGLRPLEAATRIVGPDTLLLGTQEPSRNVLEPIALRMRAALYIVHQRNDVLRLDVEQRLVAVVGTEAFKSSTTPGLGFRRITSPN